MRSERRREREAARRKQILIIVLSTVLLAIFGTCLYIYSSLSAINHTDINTHTKSPAEPLKELTEKEVEKLVPLEEPKEKDGGVVNIALFGLDRRGDERCRTDTMMILSIDKDNKKIKLTSLMRDMYVEIPERGKNRINAAYAYGGPGLAMDTINENFDMDIKYYASVDFKGVQRLINKLDGVEIDVKEGEIKYLNYYISELNDIDSDEEEPLITKPGLQHLTGKQAVGYMRIRYYGDGDYERTQRQRRVLTQLYEKIQRAGILKLPGLVSTILPYVETNLSNMDIIGLSFEALSFGGDIEQYRLPVDGMFSTKIIHGMWVIVPDMEANTEKLHDFIYGEKGNIPATI